MKLLATALCALSFAPLPQSTTPLEPESIDGLLEQILPQPEELEWRDIGWRASLATAIVEARAADKPILLWAMNGHPLGCV